MPKGATVSQNDRNDGLEPTARRPTLLSVNNRRSWFRLYAVGFFPVAIFVFFNDAYPIRGNIALLLIAIYVVLVIAVVLIRRRYRANNDSSPLPRP